MVKKLFFSILLFAIFVTILAACGNSSESSITESEITSSTNTVIESPESADKGAETSEEEVLEDSSNSEEISNVNKMETSETAAGGGGPIESEETSQPVSGAINSNAYYSLDEANPFDPAGIMKQLAYSTGGGGEGYLYYGCVLIDDPNFSKPNSSSSNSRALYPGEDSEGCICGVDENDNVNVALQAPDGNQISLSNFPAELGASADHASSFYYMDGTTGESNSCIKVKHDYIFIPGDPLGNYLMTVTVRENVFVDEFIRTDPQNPVQYYAPRLGGYVFAGFDPFEEVTVIFYIVSEEENNVVTGELLQATSIKLDENGSAIILSDDPNLELRTIRGEPTEYFFEVWGKDGQESEGLIDWDYLLEQNPDNPYVYYHSGQDDNAVEIDPNFLLVRFDRALSLIIMDFPQFIEVNSVKQLFWVNEEGNSQVRQLAYNSINDEYLDTGIEDLSAVLAIDPEDIVALLARGTIFAIQEKPDQAISDFEKVINLKSNLLIAYSLKAEVEFHLLNQPEKAQETIYQASLELAKDPDSFAADDLANLATTFGNTPLAVDLYTQAIDTEYRDYVKSSYLITRANLYQQLGDNEKANSDFQDALLLSFSMAYVPEGEFLMGTNSTDLGTEAIEQPQHLVNLDGFYIDKLETTVAAYQLCIQAGACSGNPSTEPVDGAVTNVSWADANAYCNWLGKRLPTEAEWEKASRGDDQRLYPWGNEQEKLAVCEVNYDDIREGVAYNNLLFLNDNSCLGPFGLNHAVGNVWEWTADYFDGSYYSVSPSTNPLGPDSGEERVLRGGSWSTNNPNFLRVTNRWSRPEDFTRNDVGFRCAISAE
ncbi:MAG: SUMF1/EgtB/PvdO family nonheme iron enzyme [Anaerolineales bacterium]|nr:SUMF1/EgtB/PvdO family nonheme iron enzyme [Anaerolineales bacterium]